MVCYFCYASYYQHFRIFLKYFFLSDKLVPVVSQKSKLTYDPMIILFEWLYINERFHSAKQQTPNTLFEIPSSNALSCELDSIQISRYFAWNPQIYCPWVTYTFLFSHNIFSLCLSLFFCLSHILSKRKGYRPVMHSIERK